MFQAWSKVRFQKSIDMLLNAHSTIVALAHAKHSISLLLPFLACRCIMALIERRVICGYNSDGKGYTEKEFYDYFSSYGPYAYVKYWQEAKPDKRSLCVINSAVSGERLLAFRVTLPHCLSPNFIKQHTLEGGYVLDGSEWIHLSQFEFNEQKRNVLLVRRVLCEPPVSMNSFHGAYPRPGWRRWYKEFCKYSRQLSMDVDDTFKGVLVNDLVPYILQAFVEDARREMWRPLRQLKRGICDYMGGTALPHRFRTWDGAYHAIVRKTNFVATAKEAKAFACTWQKKHVELLQAIKEQVEDEPFRTYFE